MIKLRNILGEAYFLQVPTELTERLSGESQLTFSFSENESNREIVNTISKKWQVTNVGGQNDDKIYTVALVSKESNSLTTRVTVHCKEKQIDDLKAKRIYDNLTGSFTAERFFSTVFKGTGYKYKLDAKVKALKFENAGDGDTVLETFQKGLERYNLEFKYVPKTKTFILTKKVFQKADYFIENGTNALNFKLEEDSSEFYTYIRGYGNFDDNVKFQEASMQLIYKHPLADDIGIYEAPAIIDGRIKDEEFLRNKMINTVDNSLKTSLTLDFITLQEEYAEAVPVVGDLVPVKDDIIDVFDFVRIVEVQTKRDINNKIFEQNATLGDYKKRDRYNSKVSNSVSLANSIGGSSTDIREAKDKIKGFVSAANNVLDMGNALRADSKGIKSVNKLLNTVFTPDKGIAISNDGGKTFVTALDGDGVNVDVIPVATTTKKGLMSKDDKIKLDNLNGVGSSRLGSIFYKEVK
ncbi:phage tail protein [Staphylococcus pseudintermedius]|uniref:tail tube TT1 domain-containing protein n=1 Tax=Staphylococcus pseudintermedius TaxID=283734 RepID=UPI0038575245